MLVNNIVLSGGTTMFPGFSERLKNEFNNVCSLKKINQGHLSKLRGEKNSLIHGIPDEIFSRVNYYSQPRSKFLSRSGNNRVWLGGSLLGSLDTFGDQCITREEYEETGPSVIHRKCF